MQSSEVFVRIANSVFECEHVVGPDLVWAEGDGASPEEKSLDLWPQCATR